jgi:hypothetical protein
VFLCSQPLDEAPDSHKEKLWNLAPNLKSEKAL